LKFEVDERGEESRVEGKEPQSNFKTKPNPNRVAYPSHIEQSYQFNLIYGVLKERVFAFAKFF
jgi:hypothetical protein